MNIEQSPIEVPPGAAYIGCPFSWTKPPAGRSRCVGGVVEEVRDDGYAAAASEFLPQVVQGAGAACGGDASHAGDGGVGGVDGGVDVSQGEMSLRETCEVNGVPRGKASPLYASPSLWWAVEASWKCLRAWRGLPRLRAELPRSW
ncbi:MULTISPECIES: hypothetical protein [unclassified Streptomyces]|uniref:hypothetical protein n=1 Tax=unclassified Streptomyces TaxID=2593676 RepID=UPI0036F7C02E